MFAPHALEQATLFTTPRLFFAMLGQNKNSRGTGYKTHRDRFMLIVCETGPFFLALQSALSALTTHHHFARCLPLFLFLYPIGNRPSVFGYGLSQGGPFASTQPCDTRAEPINYSGEVRGAPAFPSLEQVEFCVGGIPFPERQGGFL